jgi:hypothetical protein
MERMIAVYILHETLNSSSLIGKPSFLCPESLLKSTLLKYNINENDSPLYIDEGKDWFYTDVHTHLIAELSILAELRKEVEK